MFSEPIIALTLVALLVYALAADWIDRSPLSGPMIFTGFGLLIGPLGFGFVGPEAGDTVFVLATATLVIILFRDAANIRLRRKADQRETVNLTLRLLLAGIPLTIVLGTAFGFALFPGLSFLDAVILAIVLTPTDAALAQPVFANRTMPEAEREALDAESGLNDGLCLPLLLIALDLSTLEDAGQHWLDHFGLFAGHIVLGPLTGVMVGAGGAWLARHAFAWKIARPNSRTPLMVILAGLAYVGAELIGGNGFLAAFTAGLGFGVVLPRPMVQAASNFAQTEGTILTSLTFVLFGAAFLPAAAGSDLLWPAIIFAALALTVMRMLPVYLVLEGAPVSPVHRLVLGWFGPRGVASILYLLVIADKAGYAPLEDIKAIAVWAIGMSILLHGVTAPLIGRFYPAMDRGKS